MRKPWVWTEAEDERLKALVAQGASVARAAAALKRTIASVRTHARALGCPFPPLRVTRQKWTGTPDHVSRKQAVNRGRSRCGAIC
jgi:hypothetical protein